MLTEYAKWLQVVLTSVHVYAATLLITSSCSETSCVRLAPATVHPACRYLEMAAGALTYQEGPEGALHGAAEQTHQ
jgi:hypothetical protein